MNFRIRVVKAGFDQADLRRSPFPRDHAERTEMYHRMVELAATYDGFLGIEPARNTDGSGVAAIYWKDTDSIAAFSRDPEHLIAKKKGREIWYSHYMIRICKVERQYGRSD